MIIATYTEFREPPQTLNKNLIATFGIGLLSCFKASADISIRTCKENGTPLQFKLTGVSDNINPEKSLDPSIGTTILVELKDDMAQAFKPYDSVYHYFRQVKQVGLRILELEWESDLLSYSRDEIFKVALTEAGYIESRQYFDSEEGVLGVELTGEDFSGSIWLPESDLKALIKVDGSVDVLNEGVFVTEQSTEDWLPMHLSVCNVMLNFSSGAISLPAGRDRVIKDELFRSKKRIITDKSFGLIDMLVLRTGNKDNSERDYAALVLAYMYQEADEDARGRLIKRLDNYHVRRYKRDARVTLKELSDYEDVYVQYNKGRFVSDLTELDGKLLYHKEDDFIELQSAILAQEERMVITAIRSDAEEVTEAILEANLIMAYLANEGCNVIDLATTNVIEGKQRSKPVPSEVRQVVGSEFKFVEIIGLPSKKAWKVGDEIWINLANPSMKSIYSELTIIQADPRKLALLSVLLRVLSYKFDDAIQGLVRLIKE